MFLPAFAFTFDGYCDKCGMGYGGCGAEVEVVGDQITEKPHKCMKNRYCLRCGSVVPFKDAKAHDCSPGDTPCLLPTEETNPPENCNLYPCPGCAGQFTYTVPHKCKSMEVYSKYRPKISEMEQAVLKSDVRKVAFAWKEPVLTSECQRVERETLKFFADVNSLKDTEAEPAAAALQKQLLSKIAQGYALFKKTGSKPVEKLFERIRQTVSAEDWSIVANRHRGSHH